MDDINLQSKTQSGIRTGKEYLEVCVIIEIFGCMVIKLMM